MKRKVRRPIRMLARWLLAASLWTIAGFADAAPDNLSMRSVELAVKHVDYRFAVGPGSNGVPRMDWERFRQRPRKTVVAHWKALELENEFLRVTLVPAMGRIHSFVNKQTGQEQLWINPCAVPLPANNDTGFWMVWGGIERVLPRGEHGTTHALTWEYRTQVDTQSEKKVECRVREPMTGIQLTLTFFMYAARPYLETRIVLENRSSSDQSFSHWTTAVLAPGGRGEVTPNTELILPAARFVPDDRDFNQWMTGIELDTRTSPLRFAKNWKSIGDLMTTDLQQPFYAVYSHEKDEGLAHSFDLNITPTVDIWSWGFPPTERRARQFTQAVSNQGYVEFWNGNAKDFKDDSLQTIRPGEVIRWTEKTFPLTRMLHRADLRQAITARVKTVLSLASPSVP